MRTPARRLQHLPGLDHLAELPLMAAVAAVAVGVVAANQLRIALARPCAGRYRRRGPSRPARAVPLAVKRSTARRRASGRKRAAIASSGSAKSRQAGPGIAAGMGERPGRPLPPGDRRLRRLDLLRAHPLEEIIAWRCARGHARGTASRHCRVRRNRTASAARGIRPARGSRAPSSARPRPPPVHAIWSACGHHLPPAPNASI